MFHLVKRNAISMKWSYVPFSENECKILRVEIRSLVSLIPSTFGMINVKEVGSPLTYALYSTITLLTLKIWSDQI
jgi:hypothetical protein